LAPHGVSPLAGKKDERENVGGLDPVDPPGLGET